MKCKECKYFVLEKEHQNISIGTCRESCPQMGPQGYGYWPYVKENDYCFKFKANTLNG